MYHPCSLSAQFPRRRRGMKASVATTGGLSPQRSPLRTQPRAIRRMQEVSASVSFLIAKCGILDSLLKSNKLQPFREQCDYFKNEASKVRGNSSRMPPSTT